MSLCGAVLNVSPLRTCLLPIGHDGDHEATVAHRAVDDVDMVNQPPHYTRGPMLHIGEDLHRLECIEVVRHINDFRLANAMKYIWRVAFGGKVNDPEDIQKARWYLSDWLDHPI